MNRRKFLGFAGPALATGAVCTQIASQPKSRPDHIETGQVYRTQDGLVRIVGDRVYEKGYVNCWTVCGPYTDRCPRVDWVYFLEIQSWTYLGSLKDLGATPVEKTEILLGAK